MQRRAHHSDDLAGELRRDRSRARARLARRRATTCSWNRMRYDGTPSTAPTVCSITRSVVIEARRIEDAEPIADRERQRRRDRDHRPARGAVRVLRRAAGRVERRVLDDQPRRRATPARPRCAGRASPGVGLVLAKRQIADRARVVAPARRSSRRAATARARDADTAGASLSLFDANSSAPFCTASSKPNAGDRRRPEHVADRGGARRRSIAPAAAPASGSPRSRACRGSRSASRRTRARYRGRAPRGSTHGWK